MIDLLVYAVILGCEFVALLAMTTGVRGRISPLRGVFACALLAAADAAMEIIWRSHRFDLDLWLAVHFAVCWMVFSALILWLSRDSLGRRIFLALAYGTYALGYSSLFDVIVYRRSVIAGNEDILDSLQMGLVAVGLASSVFLNFAYVRWVLPRLPRDGHNDRWRDPCLVAGVMFAAMFASCRWPISVTSAPIRDCVPFVLVSVAAWIAFPMVCGRLRDRRRTADIAHSLDLMMAEVKERRVAIDFARRLRHDQRHHRAQIAEYMLAGQYDRVFDYLKSLDEEAQEAPTGKLVWCENETVNAILSGAHRQATAKGVGFDAEVHVERTIPISDIDLVALLANLLENAVNAAAAGRSAAARRVTVTLRQREHGLGITVANPVPPGFALSAQGHPCAEPGVGLESVRRVVGRHDGQWSYELGDGLLKCRVILMFPIA